MKTTCPHCTQHISIDPETLAELQGQEHFPCPACGGLVPVPQPTGAMPIAPVRTDADTLSFQSTPTPTAANTPAQVHRGLNRNLLILGSAALLVLGGLGFFLASRSGSIFNSEQKITNEIIHNSYFQNLIAAGATSRTDLEAMAFIRPYGRGFMGISKESLTWKQAQNLAERVGAEIPSSDQSDPSWLGPPEVLGNSLPALAGATVWLQERGDARVLGSGMIVDPESTSNLSSQIRHKVMLYWRREAVPAPLPFEKVIAEWETLKYGMYVHWGPPTYQGVTLPGSMGFEPEQWAKVAKQAGMRYGVLTAKHELGYCLWDSKDYLNDIGGLPGTTDLVRRFVGAFQAEGLKAGVHYSIPDAFSEGKVINKGPVPDKYFQVIKQHTSELHTRFPDIFFHVFETANRLSASQRLELYKLVRKLNPDCIIQLSPYQSANNCLFYSGPAEGLGDGCYEPVHLASTVIPGWSFFREDLVLKPSHELAEHYRDAVARKASFLLNIAPNLDGLIPVDQIRVLMEVKEQIKDIR